MAEFPRIQQQGNAIACVYKAIGLYSIPLLTLVTTVSLSNVFTAGSFARVAGIETVWAVIFSAAIEVNSVRLFIESAINDDRSAFVIGIILSIVAGTALLIEGLQQSIGLDWNSQDIHLIIALLVGFRVFCVVVLLAREGRKLGHVLKENPVVKTETIEGLPEVLPENKPEVIEPPITESIQIAEDVLPLLKTYPKIYSWLDTGQKTTTLEDVIATTNHSKKMLTNRLNDGTFKRSPRNQNLILISSVMEWLKVAPSPGQNGQETMPLEAMNGVH